MDVLPFLVRVVGVEPTRISPQEPKSCTSANSVIPAYIGILAQRRFPCQSGDCIRHILPL